MRRRLFKYLVPALTGACALACAAVLALVVIAIGKRGLPALTWHFFTEQIRSVGADGGIFYNIAGTLILLLACFVCTAPFAIGIAVTRCFYLRSPRLRNAIDLCLYVLNGVPSILFGIFGMIVFTQFLGWGKSWLAGGILLAMMILPTVTVATITRIESIPPLQIEAARGLGLRRSQIVWSILMPRCLGGLLTGSLLGLARAAGETAPIMFTATIFAGATLPAGIKESPVLSLPYHIFILAQDSFDPSVGSKLWGTALTLLLLVFILSFLALPARIKGRSISSHD